MQRSNRKVRTGRVISDKMDKTRVVSVEGSMRHPLYEKTIKSSKKFKAHDENNQAQAGDWVRIMETRPLSKHKRWRIVEVIEKARF